MSEMYITHTFTKCCQNFLNSIEILPCSQEIRHMRRISFLWMPFSHCAILITSQGLLRNKNRPSHKNIERHTAHTIVSWPNPKQQWVIVHTSDLMMIIRQRIYILSIIRREMGKLKTHSPTYYIIDNRENMLNLPHTLDKIYLTGIL